MKVLLICPAGDGLAMGIRAGDAGHEVKVWFGPREGAIGEGMVDRVVHWKPYMKWADLIIISYNSIHSDDFEPYFKQGYPIFGCNKAGLALESDRDLGMKVFEEAGIKTLPYKTFTNIDKGIAYVHETGKAYVCKPLTDADRGMTYVGEDAADLEYKLGEFKEHKLIKKGFILQEKCDGVEMAVGGWFGPNGFCSYFNENWEEKRFMNDGLGINTGEQGTTMHYTKNSALAKDVLLPLSDYLASINYVGYVDANCMIDKSGNPMPLELTMRFGWPHYDIASVLHKGDPVEWMAHLLQGHDRFRAEERVSVGVVMSHGDYPYDSMTEKEVSGVPIYGITTKNSDHVHLIKAKLGVAPVWVGGKTKYQSIPVTAGGEVLVVTAVGDTVEEARDAATDLAWDIRMPSNRQFRTDIGKRLEKHLPELQKHGYAKGVKYG